MKFSLLPKPTLTLSTCAPPVVLLLLLQQCLPCWSQQVQNQQHQLLRHSHRQLQKLPASVTPMVVTLGDSYSSGLGIHRAHNKYDEVKGGIVTDNDGVTYQLTEADNRGICFRETDTTPGAMYAAGNMPTVMLACASAEVAHATNQFNYLNAMYPEQAANNWQGSVFILTIGGNDVRSQEGKDILSALIECVTELDPLRNCNDYSSNQVVNYDKVESDLTTFFTLLATTASKATIRVMGYPKIMQRQPNAICYEIGIANEEADWVDNGIVELNTRTANAMSAALLQLDTGDDIDMQFVPVDSYFTRGACDFVGNKAQINGALVDIRNVGTVNIVSWASFHPTQLGYNAYYNAFMDSLQ